MSLFTGGIALATALAAVGTKSAFDVYGASKQSGAAQEGAQAVADAQKYAADLQAQGAAQALAFTKGQAENAFQNSESARQGNYGQYAAAQRRLGSVGQLVGFGPREIPAYVPGVDPNFTGAPASAAMPSVGQATGAPPPASASTSANLSDPSAWMSLVSNTPALSSWVQQGLGPTASPDLVNYYIGKIKGQPGANPTEQAGSANYWMQKLQSDPNVTGRAAAPAVASVGSYLSTPYQAPYAPTPITPGLPGSVGSYLNG